MTNKINLDVEIRLSKNIPKSAAIEKIPEIENFLRLNLKKFRNWKPFDDFTITDNPILEMCEKVIPGTSEFDDGHTFLEINEDMSISLQFYKLNSDGPLTLSVGDDDESVVGSQLWQLPCIEFEDIWENLIFESRLKNKMISYIRTLMLLAEKKVNPKIISVNRLVLFTGPPGTGKTSLCKGLAHHLSILLNSKFSHSVLIEINSHSLFSKWFSESGKLVQKMFDQIDEYAEDPKCMVFVLIDEVESLGMCRESSSSRSEPADAIRAVNALLTQIDRVRRRQNVLIMCTSNLENSLDRALVDRADIVQKIGSPSTEALYSMIRSCINELSRVGIINGDSTQDNESELLNICKLANGLSGRYISRLPALVLSKCSEEKISINKFSSLLRDGICERQLD